MSFHDCASWDQSLGNTAGCDGSLFLAKEYTRSENAGLEQTVPTIGAMAQKYGVGVADFFQFAGGKFKVCAATQNSKQYLQHNSRAQRQWRSCTDFSIL
jgi:hypothetical protein